MKQRVRQSWRTYHRGSMALAVVSCALALLAAHPVKAEVSGRDEPAAVRTVGERPAAVASSVAVWTERTARRVSTPAMPRVTRREMERGQQSSQVLVALERLGSFFMSELAPRLGVGGPEVVGAFECVSLDGVVAVRTGEVVAPRAGDLPEMRERVVARERCLLAPPV